MYLENIVVDAIEPQRLGRFWEAVVGGERLTDEPDAFETRLAVEGGPVLDLCFQRVPEPPADPLRLHLDLTGGTRQAEVVERLVSLGARRLDIGQGDVPWVVLGDPEGNPFCVMEERAEPAPKGPAKNRMHLDVRLEAGDDPDAVAAGVAERGGRELHPDWGELPWRVFADPSGNELCVLPARS